MCRPRSLSQRLPERNEICEKGSDTAFYRPAHTLNPVSEPPYYAQLCVPSMLNTDGGPVRDAACQRP